MSDSPTTPPIAPATTTPPKPPVMEYASRQVTNPAAAEWGGYQDLSVTSDDDTTLLSHTREHPFVQPLVLGATTLVFTLFIIVVLPALDLTTAANAMWVVLGLAILVGVAFATQLPARTTRLRINRLGLEIDQGTYIDREHILIAWSELVAVDLEPVNPTNADKGMQLRLALKEGEPVDTLVNISVGDLTEVRRMILETAQQRREKRPV